MPHSLNLRVQGFEYLIPSEERDWGEIPNSAYIIATNPSEGQKERKYLEKSPMWSQRVITGDLKSLERHPKVKRDTESRRTCMRGPYL